MRQLDNFIIDKTIVDTLNIPNTIQKKLDKINNQINYILCCGTFGYMKNISPTLTLSGCKYMFHSTYKRYLTTKECLLLQGFNSNFINIVGDVKLCNQIGNSMSVNVLKELFKTIFKIIKRV